jgi:hypothetical protein
VNKGATETQERETQYEGEQAMVKKEPDMCLKPEFAPIQSETHTWQMRKHKVIQKFGSI